MHWFVALCVAMSAMLPRAAFAHDVRHTSFPTAMIGTWGETADKCKAKDGANVVIEPIKYGDAAGSCAVRWIVETAGADGANYAAHSLCTSAKDTTKTEVVDIIVRPQGQDRAVMGRSFDKLQTYQRCPAQ